MSDASNNKNGRRTLVRVWTCALVLALLSVISLSSIGAYAATYASRDPEVLFIDTASGSEVTSTMDLFQNAYVNAQGQTVVAGSDGSKVVAPGTSGSYEFAVRNSGGQPATYKVWAQTEQDGTTKVVPLQVSLVSGQSVCQNLADAGELEPGKSAIYSIAWQWPFEEGQTAEARTASNARDTTLGDEAAAHRVTYKVTLHMAAEAEYPAAPQPAGRTPFTGEAVLPVALLVVLGMVLVIVAVIARRRRNDDDADKSGR